MLTFGTCPAHLLSFLYPAPSGHARKVRAGAIFLAR